MLPKDFPNRFFSPLTSKHRDNYIYIILAIETVLEQFKQITMPRNDLVENLRRLFMRDNYTFDVSDEEDYNETVTDDIEQDNLAYTLRRFLHSRWIDADDTGDYGTESICITLYGKKLTSFLRDIERTDNQSGHVQNTYSNLEQVRKMPDAGYVYIQNAYESTEKLLITLQMMYPKIKKYYSQVLEDKSPEELLTGHFHGYVQDVVDKLIFPIKVDDSIDRFKGPIINKVYDIQSDSALLEQVISSAKQSKRILSDEGLAQVLDMLAFIKSSFADIDLYVKQLDEKNNNYIRITRQKLAYMLSTDTSIKGDIIAILRNAKMRNKDYLQKINSCLTTYDIRQVSDNSFFKLRKRRIINTDERLGIEEAPAVSQEDVNSIFDSQLARYTGAKINDYAHSLLDQKETVTAKDVVPKDDHDYLMAIYLALNSTNHKRSYDYHIEEGMVTRGIYSVADFTIKKRGK